MSNFSFSKSGFKRLVLQTCKNQGLFWKELNHDLCFNGKNTVGIGAMTGFKHFLFSCNQFQKPFTLTLLNDKFLNQSKLKLFADSKISTNGIVRLNFYLEREENIVGKEQNAGYQDFLLFLQHFPKA